jgi:hypothetical protein
MQSVYIVVHVDHMGNRSRVKQFNSIILASNYIDELIELYQWSSYGEFKIDIFLNGARFDHLPMWKGLGVFVCDQAGQRWI